MHWKTRLKIVSFCPQFQSHLHEKLVLKWRTFKQKNRSYILCDSYYKYGTLGSFRYPKLRPVRLIECSLNSKSEQFLLNVLFECRSYGTFSRILPNSTFNRTVRLIGTSEYTANRCIEMKITSLKSKLRWKYLQFV